MTVFGTITEYIQGNKELHTDKDRLRVANGKRCKIGNRLSKN